MLTRKQLRLIQQARGLTLEEIVQRTGTPPKSLMAFINGAEKDGKDPQKLMSASTFDSVIALLGVNAEFGGLRQGVVIEWCYAGKQRKDQEYSWEDAVTQLRKSMLGDDLHLAELKLKTGVFQRVELMIFIYDPTNDIRIVVTGANKRARAFLEKVCNAEVERSELLPAGEFAFRQGLIRNGVYRVSNFNNVLSKIALKYDWDEVKAAAVEFNFTTEQVINLMVEAVRSAPAATPPVSAEVEHLPFLRNTG